MTGCLPLTIAGGFLEVAGLSLVAWEITRIQREEFGTPRFILRAQAWVRRRLGRSVSHNLGVADSIEVADDISVRRRAARHPGMTLEERIDALERDFGFLEDELTERDRKVEHKLRAIEQRQTEMRQQLDQEHREREERRKMSLRAAITLQAFGTVLFFFGAVLSVLGNAVSC